MAGAFGVQCTLAGCMYTPSQPYAIYVCSGTVALLIWDELAEIALYNNIYSGC